MLSSAVPCANHPDQLAVATCGRCGDFICAACAHPQGASMLCGRCIYSAPSGPAPIPWEDRGERGWMAAWWATTAGALLSVRGLVSGNSFFGRVGARGGYGPATGYAFVSLGLWLTMGGLTAALQSLPDLWEAPSAVRWDSGPGAVLVMIPLMLVVMFVSLVPFLYVQAALVHTAGMVFGVDQGGFRGTFRACAYSTGGWPLFGALSLPLVGLEVFVQQQESLAGLASVLDVLGTLVFLLALGGWGVLLFAALRGVHAASTLRSLGVVGTLLLGVVCSCGLLFGVVFLASRF